MAKVPARVRSDVFRAWFPIALIVLTLVALPGAILLVLTLFGRETQVNAWLEDRSKISYHLFLAWWAGLLLLLVPLFIILLYFLKLKRRPLHVPSTFLWKKSIEDLHVNSLFQWLRENVLLLLQVLTALLIIYSVLAFQLHGRSTESKRYILMIDNSASMSAEDVSPNRLERAKQEAIEEIDAHGEGDYGMVIVFNSTAQILLSYTNDQGLLRRTVQSIPQSHAITRIDDALDLADSLANPNRPTDADSGKAPVTPTEGVPTKVHLFSDGRFPDVARFAKANLNFEYHAVGEPGASNVNNVGIVDFNATRDESDVTRLNVLVRVANYRTESVNAKVRLEVKVGDDNLRAYDETVPLDGRRIDANGSAGDPPAGSAVFDVTDVSDQANVVLHAYLVGNKDHFKLDDEAWLVVGVVRKARVLIVESGERVLHSFFDQPAIRKVARVSYIAPVDLDDDDKYGKPARNGDYDLIVFSRKGPRKKEDMPLANTWFIDCLPPGWEKAQLPKIDYPRVKMNKHPLLRNLTTLQDIVVVKTAPCDMRNPEVPAQSPRLLELEGDAAVLFVDQSRQPFKDLVQTFPFFDEGGLPMTDWFLQLGFPTFLRNVLYQLGNVNDAASEETIRPGQPKTIWPDVTLKEIKVHDPKDHVETLQRGPRTDFLYGKTDLLGVYMVSWNGAPQRSFAVNLLDEQESNLEPRSQFKIGEDVISAGEMSNQPVSLWKWVALAALVVLMVEWFIYNRRVYV